MIEIVLVGNIATCGMESFRQHLRTPNRLSAYPCDLDRAEVLVGSPVSRSMIERAPELRLIHTSGAGYDNVAMDALSDAVRVCNVFHHEGAIAEYVMMTVLALDRDLLRLDRNLRQGIWEGSCVTSPPAALELTGRTLGIVGFGHIGKEVARLAAAFGMEIRSLRSGHTRAELEGLLRTSDFLLLACPLSAETRGLIGAAELAQMRPSASLINVARGEVVDEAALYQALRDRRIRSAAIDVWYQYPDNGSSRQPSQFAFDKLDNVIMTPHSSAWTQRVIELRVRDIAANIDRLASGEPLSNIVR